jgi:hypothetical protein
MTGSATPELPGWRKSSYSAEVNCVELAKLPDGRIVIRNGDDPGRIATCNAAELDAFLKGVKAGEFDDLVG